MVVNPLDPVNRDSFFPPKLAVNEARARGADPSTGFMNGGMGFLQRVHLPVGQNYYRFGDSDRFAIDWRREAAGGWWVDYNTFNIIRTFAKRSEAVQEYAAKIHQPPLAYATKLFLAVPYEWGDCGALCVVNLKRRLDAFKGRGKPANLGPDEAQRDPRDGRARYIPLPNAEVAQLYIPELRDHFDAVFDVVSKGPTPIVI